MKDSVRVAFYARVSSQKQSDNNTIDSQCEALRKRIENDGFTFPSEYAFYDDGYSGSELMRPALEKLRDRVYTLNAVVRELRSRQIETSTGKLDWISSTLRGILTNTSYHGEARYGKKRLVPLKPGKRPSRGHPEVSRYSKVGARTELSEQFVVMVPAIVDRPLFERVAITMDENLKRQRERLVGTKFLLSGTLICGQCGSAYCARARPNGKHQYRCIGNDKFRCGEREKCTNTSVYGVELESTVWLELCKLLQEPNRLRQELENNANDPQYDQKLKALQQELKTYREQLDRLIDAYTIERTATVQATECQRIFSVRCLR